MFHVGIGIQSQISISDDDVQRQIYTPFINDDVNLETELRGHLLQKNDRFAITEITFMKDVMDKHQQDGLQSLSVSQGSEVLELVVARHLTSSGYRPQTNGRTERINRIVNQ